MSCVDVLLTPRDPLVLRDGRPFGQIGLSQSGGFLWPRPGTVAGMLRSRIGLNHDPKFFQENRADNIKRILTVSLLHCLPAFEQGDAYELCFPAPADAVAFPKAGRETEEQLEVKPLVPQPLGAQQGVDFQAKSWWPARLADPRKPVATCFWRWSHLKHWLIDQELSPFVCLTRKDLGWEMPSFEERTHVCIDGATQTAEDAKLFVTRGARYPDSLHMAIRVDVGDLSVPQGADIAHLGGDRRTVFLSWSRSDIAFPEIKELPDIGRNTNGLRLILMSPGVFANGWGPQWLLDGLESGQSVYLPGTDIAVFLRSAVIPRWEPLHGWDMNIGKYGAPKWMRKAVPAGAVYFLEVQDGARVREAAKGLWGASLCEVEQDRRDGLGRVLVGNWRISDVLGRR